MSSRPPAGLCYVLVTPAEAPWNRASAGCGGSEGARRPHSGRPARPGHGRGRGLRRRDRDGDNRVHRLRRHRPRPRAAAGARRRGGRSPGCRADDSPHPHAYRRRRGRRPGRRPQPGRRRLPGQAVRVRRTGRADPGPGQAQPVRAAGRAARGPDRGPGPAAGQPGGTARRADPQGVRRAGNAARRRRRRRQRRGTPGTRVGHQHRPVQQHGVGHRFAVASQARRPATHRDRHRQMIPAVRSSVKMPGFLRRRPVRLRLALIYSGLFLLAGAVLLTVTYGLAANTLPTGPSGNLSAKAARFANSDSFPGLKTCKQNAASPQAVEKCKYEATQAAAKLAAEVAANARAQTLNDLLDYSLAALALMTVLSGVLGWIVAGRALRPVHAITAAARRASEQNLSERIALAGPADELKELADTFDAMLARLEAAFASQRRFVANASHELRTPLTEMRTLIDVTTARPAASPEQLQPVLAAIGAAVDKSEELIEALLTLARSDRGPGPVELVDLPTAVEDAIDSIGPAAAARQIQIGTALQHAQVTGDRVLLERLVSNLIDNAVKHNVTGGWVLASTRTETGTAELTVANGGEHIPADQVTGLFEPFRRLSGRTGTRPGAGLGLSIVASVANAHGGHAQAHARPDGGLDVQITLPATPNRHSPTPHQPHTTAAQTSQPDHRIPPAAGQGRPVADGSGLS